MATMGLVYDITDAPKKGISIKELMESSFLAVQKEKDEILKKVNSCRKIS